MKMLTLVIAVFAFMNVNAQKCDCKQGPPYPTRKCADSCIRQILTNASVKSLVSFFNIKDSTAGKIVGVRTFTGEVSVGDLKGVLTQKEFANLKDNVEAIQKAAPNQ